MRDTGSLNFMAIEEGKIVINCWILRYYILRQTRIQDMLQNRSYGRADWRWKGVDGTSGRHYTYDTGTQTMDHGMMAFSFWP